MKKNSFAKQVRAGLALVLLASTAITGCGQETTSKLWNGAVGSRTESSQQTDAENNQASAQGDETDQSSYIFTMGTVFQIRVLDQVAGERVTEVTNLLNELDRLISWRNEESLAATFNREHIADMSDIDEMISTAMDVSRKSQGAFDLTVLPLSQLWNFDRIEDPDFNVDELAVPDQKDIDAALADIDYNKLIYDQASCILTTDDERCQIELGAIGKGYAISKAVDQLSEKGVQGALISAGSSIYAYGSKDDGSGFKVALRDPRGSLSDYIGIFDATDMSVTTSGDYERYFEADGKRYHHILDPRTGYPAESGLMQVTIITPDATLGDALSTACFVLGLEEGMALASEYDVLAIFVDNDKKVWYNNSDILDYFQFIGETSGYHLCEYK